MRKDRKYPILLNYTGEIVKLKADLKNTKNDPRFKVPKISAGDITYLVLPPLGKATVKHELNKDVLDVFPTVHYIVEGLPDPIPEVFYIVNTNVAKILSRRRNDLLILWEAEAKSSKNVLKPDEIILECTDFAHVLVEI